MSTLSAAPERGGKRIPASAAPAEPRSPTINVILGTGLAAALAALAFLTSGTAGQTVTGAGTWSQIVLTLLGAAACIVMIAFGERARAWGAASIALFAMFTAFAGLSIVWSVQPDWSWFGANQLLSYLAVFAGAAALARTFPERWPALVGAVAAAMVAVSAYSLLAKVFPGSLAPTNTYGRLQAPFGYWNALGLAAALGLPPCLWAAARRGAAWPLRAIAVPGITVLLSVIALSYSRSAALAAVIGTGGFVAFAPLRLRTMLVLTLGAVGAVPIVAWALGQHALTTDNTPLPAQVAGGHSFGWILLIVMVAMTGIGVLAAIGSDRVRLSPRLRRRLGLALVLVAALIPVAAVVGLAASSRGLTGEISHAWHTLTSSTSKVGDTSSRITQLGSSRPMYWHQGLQVGGHALLKGAGELGYGVARLQYTTQPYVSDQAHSYLVQTFADLGLIGVVITLGLLGAWGWAALRSLGVRVPWRVLAPGQVSEREGLVALATAVVVFGVQSALDWTWYFPGVAVPALVCAGWLAGRGPLLAPVGRRRPPSPARDRPAAIALIIVVAAVAVTGAWLMWQPWRSVQDSTAAELASDNAGAFAAARRAAGADPLSLQPLFELSALYQAVGDSGSARSALAHATRLQPQNPAPWVWLAQFDERAGRPRLAVGEANRVLALDHTLDANTNAARATIAAATAHHARRAAQRTARASSSRRHSGHPPAVRTST